MNEGNPELHSSEKKSVHPIRLPGFIMEDIGLGDVIKQVTTKAGIRPCAGCDQRAARFNRWVVFTGQRSR
jgi:hypothetical protein